ncbi:peptidoglycan DD-metalloendopeptidase family protein [Ruminococcaceae bacterium OttesenSCG-928-N02]|nr:peptidoglycan DD-metalloendopeptidase family protein [Ruminococcaceae bacterium OttesenSCG-928-N02]
MKQKKSIRMIAALLAILLLSSLLIPLFAFAETPEEEYNRLQQELNQIQQDLNGIRNNRERQQAAATAAKKQIAIIAAQIDALARAIQQTEEELAAKEEELAAKRVELQETEELFAQRLRALYMMRGTSELEALLGAESFSQYLTANETLRRISRSDTELIARLEEERRIIEEAEAEIRATLERLEGERANMASKQAEYAQQLQVANAAMSALEAEQQATQQVFDATFLQYLAAKEQVSAEFIGSNGEFVGGTWLWPVPGYHGRGYVSSFYGYRSIWNNGYTEFHNGIDIARGPQASIMNAPIVASNSGYVLRAKYNAGGYGYYVMLDHGGNTYSLYGHCSSYIVTVGQYVTQGQVIGYVGSTGNSTGPHLHFEIRMNGVTVDPAPLLGI